MWCAMWDVAAHLHPGHRRTHHLAGSLRLHHRLDASWILLHHHRSSLVQSVDAYAVSRYVVHTTTTVAALATTLSTSVSATAAAVASTASTTVAAAAFLVG